jgi:hypothetical protein
MRYLVVHLYQPEGQDFQLACLFLHQHEKEETLAVVMVNERETDSTYTLVDEFRQCLSCQVLQCSEEEAEFLQVGR